MEIIQKSVNIKRKSCICEKDSEGKKDSED